MTTRSECLFCKIASKTVPAHIVYETDRIVAFLDINPIRPGHTQIAPKAHFAYFDDLPPDLLFEIASTGQVIARALKAIYRVQRVGFAFTGTDIPHVHGHIVPLVAPDDLTSRRYIVEDTVTYRNPPRPTHEEFMATAREIVAQLSCPSS